MVVVVAAMRGWAVAVALSVRCKTSPIIATTIYLSIIGCVCGDAAPDEHAAAAGRGCGCCAGRGRSSSKSKTCQRNLPSTTPQRT